MTDAELHWIEITNRLSELVSCAFGDVARLAEEMRRELGPEPAGSDPLGRAGSVSDRRQSGCALPEQTAGPPDGEPPWLPFSRLEARVILALAERPCALSELAGRLGVSLSKIKYCWRELRERKCLRRGPRGIEVPCAEIAVAARTCLDC
jgi:hypothetical protein